MNGFAVAQAVHERPPETLLLEGDPMAVGIRGYFAARNATIELEAHHGDTKANAATLAGFVLKHDSLALDVAPSMTHRYIEANRFMSAIPGGQESLSEAIHARLDAVHGRLTDGYVYILTPSIHLDGHGPKLYAEGKDLFFRLSLPPTIQRRSLAWNEWAQSQIEAGDTDMLFTDEFARHGVKVANGDLLPAGNLWVEVGEAAMRIRQYPYVTPSPLELAWGLVDDPEWDPGSSLYIMSHIVEKGILRLAETVGPDLVDGMHLTDEVYVQSYKPIVELIDANPDLDIKGILSDGSWIYSNELARVFPHHHVSKIRDVAGHVIERGPAEAIGAPIQAEFATRNPERHAAYEAGRYLATVAARFISREGMIEQLDHFSIS